VDRISCDQAGSFFLKQGYKNLQACSLQLKTTSSKQGWPVQLPQGFQPNSDLFGPKLQNGAD